MKICTDVSEVYEYSYCHRYIVDILVETKSSQLIEKRPLLASRT